MWAVKSLHCDLEAIQRQQSDAQKVEGLSYTLPNMELNS